MLAAPATLAVPECWRGRLAFATDYITTPWTSSPRKRGSTRCDKFRWTEVSQWIPAFAGKTGVVSVRHARSSRQACSSGMPARRTTVRHGLHHHPMDIIPAKAGIHSLRQVLED